MSVALHDLTGSIMVVRGERLDAADIAHRIQNLTDIGERHGELADRDRGKLVQHLNADHAGLG